MENPPNSQKLEARGYLCDAYDRKEYLTDLPPKYEFFNDYDYVSFMQNKESKDLFDVSFGMRHEDNESPEEYEKKKQTHRKIQIDKKRGGRNSNCI